MAIGLSRGALPLPCAGKVKTFLGRERSRHSLKHVGSLCTRAHMRKRQSAQRLQHRAKRSFSGRHGGTSLYPPVLQLGTLTLVWKGARGEGPCGRLFETQCAGGLCRLVRSKAAKHQHEPGSCLLLTDLARRPAPP